MPISLISWPNPYGLGAPLYLVPQTKYERYASIAEIGHAGSPLFRALRALLRFAAGQPEPPLREMNWQLQPQDGL